VEDRAHDQSTEDVQREPGDAVLLAGPVPTLQREVIRLQHAIGNRAVARFGLPVLARQPASPTSGGFPSKLVGLKRTLGWDDFKGPVPKSSPFLSGTFMGIDRKVGGSAFGTGSFEASGSSFKLKDAVVITINFDEKKSWENTGSLKASEAQLLLEHEQGHYDIAALVARDMFIAIMALKPQMFPTQQDGLNALSTVANQYGALLTKIDNLYDSTGETGHRAFESLSFGPPRKPPPQEKWEKYLKRARTEERNPPVTAPDGATYKVELADILRAAGHQI
jgi:hypothetical protein